MTQSAGAASLSDVLRPDCVALELKSATKEEVLSELCGLLASAHGLLPQPLVEAVLKREELGCTGIGAGVAVPHARCPSTAKTCLAVGISKAGIPYGAPDGQPVRLLFLLIGPPDSASLHLRLLSGIAHLVKEAEVRGKLLAARDPEEVRSLLRA